MRNLSEYPERRKYVFQITKSLIKEFDLICNSSKLSCLVRVMAWMLRFISNIRSRVSNVVVTHQSINLQADEIKATEILCIRLTQKTYFSTEYNCLIKTLH